MALKNQEGLQKVDPVANFLTLVNKLQYIVSLPPSLKKDPRQLQVESFYRQALFTGKAAQGQAIKGEILKLLNCSREPVLSSKDVSIITVLI